MKFYAPTKLGKKQALTKEGFLLCSDVAIARTGELLYAADEVPVEPGRDGIIRIMRGDDQVFREETLASFEGKPVTLGHPDEEVTPGNYASVVKGVVQNVRRGEGISDDLVIGDLLIMDQDAIDAVRDDGIREVSCGYDADYEQLEPGRGRQLNIVGNHVALVEAGRCGSRCAIQDRSTIMSWKDKVRLAFKSKDEKALDALLDENAANADSTHVHVHLTDKAKDEEAEEKKKTEDAEEAFQKKVADAVAKALAARDEEMKKKDDDKTEDEEEEEGKKKTDDEEEKEDEGKKKTGDSAKAIMQDVLARAELLSPGIKLPTFDAKKKVKDNVCACQRRALEMAYQTDEGRQAIAPFLMGRRFNADAMTSSELNSVFVGASELIRQKNNADNVRTAVTTKDFSRPTSIQAINEANQKFWNDRRSVTRSH